MDSCTVEATLQSSPAEFLYRVEALPSSLAKFPRRVVSAILLLVERGLEG